MFPYTTYLLQSSIVPLFKVIEGISFPTMPLGLGKRGVQESVDVWRNVSGSFLSYYEQVNTPICE